MLKQMTLKSDAEDENRSFPPQAPDQPLLGTQPWTAHFPKASGWLAGGS